MTVPDEIAAMTDAQLVTTFLATDGEPGDVWADALVAEMARREIDF